MSIRKLLPAILCLSFASVAACDRTAEQPDSGLDLTAMDKAVRPQDDLFHYVNGTWLAKTPIAPDQYGADNFIVLIEKAQSEMRKILLEDEGKLGAMYSSFMDEKAVEARGIEPLRPWFAEIEAIDGTPAVAGYIGRAAGRGINVPLGVSVHPDDRRATHNIAHVEQAGLGLPNRDYYLKTEDTYVEFRKKYVDYLAKLLMLAGEADGPVRAAKILELETKLATDQWTPVANRDPIKTYNKHSLESAAEIAPGFDWNSWYAASGLPVGDFLLYQPSYATALGRHLREVDLAVWKDYLLARTINAYARLLSAPYAEAYFDFTSRTLHDVETIEPRWKRAVQETSNAMGELMGAAYVARHFPPEAKARMVTLVDNLLAEFDRGIDRLEWMSPATRAEAHAKLKTFKVKVGYPDKWRDYSGLEIRSDDLVGNVMRANRFEWDWQGARAGQPKDPGEWLLTPQAVNAYYHPMNNEIVFPAAILQPPFFNMQADDAVNYGAIGSVIGHEISHGFDDQGRQYDGAGNLRDWWTAEDSEKFKAKAAGLVEQYSAFEALPGLNLNGELTLGENIGDVSGVAIAYGAYIHSLNGTDAPVIDGYTGPQRFFLGYAQVWRGKWREGLVREVVLTDPHSLHEFRVNGVVTNMDEFYAAFGVKEGDKLWRPAAQRVKIW